MASSTGLLQSAAKGLAMAVTPVYLALSHHQFVEQIGDVVFE